MIRTMLTGLLALIASCSLFGCSGSSPAECQPDEWSCSADAALLTRCSDGRLEQVDCRAQGLLCEQGACVEPWRYGSPQWSRCPDDPLATPESLHEKMVYYEDIVRRLHLHPQMKWVLPVLLACDGDDCSRPAVSERQATWQDVQLWLSGENDGLWSALYLAAEAYRYAVTGESEALEMVQLLLEGERQRMAITGVPGLFTRQLIPPGVEGLSCPEDLQAYVPDVEKDDNKWVRVNEDGCVEVVDATDLQWRATDHCGLEEFAGWCWLDNVSQDEYAGHMFGLAAVYRFVDDEQARAQASELLLQVGRHLVENRLRITDWDGRPVEHGRLYAMALDNFPGFNAAMALAFIKVCAAASGDAAITDFYENCLLQRKGEKDCLNWPTERPRPYTEYLDQAGLYVGQDSCLSNWNNISMHFASLHDLLLFEFDPEVRQAVQRHLQLEAFAPADTPRPVAEQNNAWFDIIYAAFKALGPGSDGPAYQAVENAVCMLRQFPASQAVPDLQCPPGKCQESCRDRLGHPLGDYPRQVAERCPGTFLWWGNPYSLNSCSANPRNLAPPTDYLLAYWMARYFGFIDDNQ